MSNSKSSRHRLTDGENFFCGGVAGVTSRTLTSPLDIVKILRQVGTSETNHGFLQTFAHLYRKEGIRSFWKGNAIACVRLFPFSGIQFMTFQAIKERFRTDYPAEVDLPWYKNLLAGGIAGVAASAATYPLDLAKTRLTVQRSDGSGRAYRNAWDCLQKVYRTEGFAALYRGITLTCISIFPFTGAMFMCYEMLHRLWGKPKSELTPLQHFLNGCIAAAISQTSTYPGDTLKKKLQAQGIVSTGLAKEMGLENHVVYKGAIDAFISIYRSEGIRGLYRGTIANLVKVTPYAGFMYLTFEMTSSMFEKNG